MSKYSRQTRMLVATDCIIFGFDGTSIKLLLIKRGLSPFKNKWSLMGGFIQSSESPKDAAARILQECTGLKDIYMEQFMVFGDPNRDPVERTLSIAYFALIDIHKYKNQLNDKYYAEWFLLNEMPDLIFDHSEIVKQAKKQLRYKGTLHPLLFNLLPEKFTMPQLRALYEEVYESEFDDRNFSRKLLSTNLLIKLKEKNKRTSRRGAFYYKLNKSHYESNSESILNLIPKAKTRIYYSAIT